MPLKSGDLVWAKMKGFTPWPARVIEPESNKKPKKNCQWIFFYGSKNYAWIENQNIRPYFSFKDKLMNSNKTTPFTQACKEIEDYIKTEGVTPPESNKIEDESPVIERVEEEKKPKKSKISTPKSDCWSPAKKLKLTTEANGSPRAYLNSNLKSTSIKHYNDIINKPSVLDVPGAPTIDLQQTSEIMKARKIQPSTCKFGFLGLGIMGSGFVTNLINSGHKVNVWSRNIEKAKDLTTQAAHTHPGQVEFFDTPSEIASNSDIIFSCLSDQNVVENIVFGNCGFMQELNTLSGKGYVELSSVDSDSSVNMCKFITDKGGRYLEAQMQGSKHEADEGNLVIIAAGDRNLFEDCNTCFLAVSKATYFLGEVGNASKLNVILQMIKGVALVGLADGLALADRAGLNLQDVVEIFSGTNACSPYLQGKCEMILNTDFQNVQQPLQHMQKDLNLALKLSDTLRQPLSMASVANEVYKHGRRSGYETYDVASVYMRTRH